MIVIFGFMNKKWFDLGYAWVFCIGSSKQTARGVADAASLDSFGRANRWGGGPACLICLEPRDTLKNSSVVTRQTTAQNPQKTDMSGNVR